MPADTTCVKGPSEANRESRTDKFVENSSRPIPRTTAKLYGKTVVVDELDLSFHTDICQWILGLFLDPEENRNGAQLIFNTHDVGLLDQEILRRDQVWFTSKDWGTYEATLTRLSDYKGVRKDLDIRRAYLNGSFGSKPFIAPDRLME